MAKKEKDADTASPERCCLCGLEGSHDNGLTGEHVPPKQFFPKKMRAGLNLWKAPTCTKCNHGSHLDEDYFVHVMWPLVANVNSTMGKAIHEELERRANQPQTRTIIRSILKTQTRKTPGGLYLPPGMVGIEADEVRLQRVAIKIARCLHFRDHGQILSDTSCFHASIHEREGDVPAFFQLLWDLSKVDINTLQPRKPGGIIVMDESVGKAPGCCPAVFDYRPAEFEGNFYYSMRFWEAFIFCLAFTGPNGTVPITHADNVRE